MNTTNLTPQTLTQEQIDLLIQEAEDVRACNEALKGDSPKQMIEFYLDYQQSRKPELNAVYPNNKQSKSIEDCYNYILDKARKQANGNSSYMAHHKIVFQWAEDYFMNEDIKKFEKTTPAKVTTKPKEYKVDTSPEAERKKYYDWEYAHKERVATWMKGHQECIDKWTKEHQMEIFFNPDDCPHLKDKCPFENEKNPYTLPEEKSEEKSKEKTEEKETNTEIINGEIVNTDTGEILESTPDEDAVGELEY